jgi:hypothetical protein
MMLTWGTRVPDFDAGQKLEGGGFPVFQKPSLRVDAMSELPAPPADSPQDLPKSLPESAER